MYPNSPFVLSCSLTVVYQVARQGWRFDWPSFASGLLVAFLLVGLVYRYRTQIVQQWDEVKGRADQLRQRLTADMAARYSASAIEVAQTMHLFGAMASLDQIYIETPLYAPLAPTEDEIAGRSWSPLQAIQASTRLLIVGQAGSGRTTLLNHLLLLQSGRLHAARAGERVPVYAYLPALAAGLVDVAAADEAGQDGEAPAERLVQTAVAPMSRLIATGVARWLRRQVEAGNAFVLLDGWDEVPVAERPAVTSWIQELSAAYPDNRLVLTAGERGYAPLVEAGFVLWHPIPWTHQQLRALSRRWAAARPDGSPAEPLPSTFCRLEPPTPLEATIELAIRWHEGRTPANTPAARMAQVMDLLLPPPETDDKDHVAWPMGTGQRALDRLAILALEQGRPILGRDEIQSTVTAAMPPPQLTLDGERAEELSRAELRAAREEQERRTLQIVDCCRALTTIGAPIRASGDRRYLFVHPLITAYLAARHLVAEAGVSTVVAHADDPAWLDVLRFYVGLAPAEPLIARLLGTRDDLFLSRLWVAAALLAAAPPGRVPWRAELMKRLTQLLANSRAPALLRDRALMALVESGEAGVGLLFKRFAAHPDPHLRAGATLGLGALGREQDIDLIEAALTDADPEVRLAAINALSILSRMGNKQATELVMATMIEAEDEAQRVAAETLAGLGAEGHAVLREGVKDQDLIVRRAAVYGLAAIDEPWAREILEEMQREDAEWLVRNAAAGALASISGDDDREVPSLDLALPKAETESWLIAWAAERGVGTGVGEAALGTLMRALSEGEAPIRYAAAETLGRMADPRTIDTLRRSLRDPEPAVRQAALVALDEIGRRHDMTISVG